MYQIIKFILFAVFIVCISLVIKNNFVKQKIIIPGSNPIKEFIATESNRLQNIQLPWCKKWNNNKGRFKCYINKHLQRKCYWSCNR